VTVKGNRLIVRLTKPDGSFLTKLTMPFFQATSRKLPLTKEVTGAYPSAGPYRFTRNDVNELTSIRRNPYYRGTRPHHLNGVNVVWNYRETPDNPVDETFPSPDQIPAIVAKYGVNKTRFWAKPVNCVGWLMFNNHHGLFKGSPGSIGARKLQPYSPGPNVARARKLAKGHFKTGRSRSATSRRARSIPPRRRSCGAT
jgi:hypothetical protein